MNWEELRIVLALVRGGTLTAAASALGVSHTTIGRRLRALEGELGVRLFDATPDGFIATAAGHDIAEVAERMESEVLALEGRVVGRDTQLRGKLRVSTMDLLLRRSGPGFASFIERHPSVELSVSTSDTQVSLARREADVALRITNAPPQDLIGRKVGRLDFALYGSRALVERYGRDPTAPGYPWLHWDERLDGGWLDGWLNQHAPRARVTMRIDFSSLAIHDAVRSGLGVHFLACFDGDADPALERLGPVEVQFGRDIWLLALPDLRRTPRVRAFMDHMKTWFTGLECDR